VTYRLIARQRLGKHILVEAYARNNRMSIGRQRNNREALSTMERLCFLRGPCRGITEGQRRSFELVDVENWTELWRWQSKVTEKEWQEMN
jgi:hypothetical protein